MNKKKLILGLIIATLSSSFNTFAKEENDAKNLLSVKTEKKEVVFIGDREIKYKTMTLKPQMFLEESIYLKNKSKEDTLTNTIYDFKIDKKSEFYTNYPQKKGINVFYSDNDGKTFSKFPLMYMGEKVPFEKYTTMRFVVDKINPLQTKELIVRYKYNHFK